MSCIHVTVYNAAPGYYLWVFSIQLLWNYMKIMDGLVIWIINVRYLQRNDWVIDADQWSFAGLIPMIPLLIWPALTKCWFAFVVGHCMQQGDGATGIACCLLQEINLRVSCNLVCLLLSERLVLPDTKTDRHKHRQSTVMVICPWEHSASNYANCKRVHGERAIKRTRFASFKLVT